MLTQNIGNPTHSFSSVAAEGDPFMLPSPIATLSHPINSALSAVCMGLTARQRDVLAVMMQGKSNKAICRILNLAEPTVKNHVTAILKALKVSNRTEAVIKVAKASVASMAYRYTISGHSTFSSPLDARMPRTTGGSGRE
jgi:DNA-binding NarL/FixJ family response regulator